MLIFVIFLLFSLYTKGASEIIMGKCAFLCTGGGAVEKFTDAKQTDVINNVITPMASGGLRTIGVAYKDFIVGSSGN